MKLEFKLKFDKKTELFVSEDIILEGEEYQPGNVDIDRRVQEKIIAEQQTAKTRLSSEFSKYLGKYRALLSFNSFCESQERQSLFNYHIVEEI